MLPPSLLVIPLKKGGFQWSSTARVERPPLHRGGSASTENYWSRPSPLMLREHRTTRIFPIYLSPSWGVTWSNPQLRATFSPAHPLARRDVPLGRARAFRFSIPLFEGVAKAALYCAHRTSTFLSCAFCEQEGHLATPFPTLDCPFHRHL
jgi:hypothetical protein